MQNNRFNTIKTLKCLFISSFCLALLTSNPASGVGSEIYTDLFSATTHLNVRVNLHANADLGETYPVNTRALDSDGRAHPLLLTFGKTAKPLEWALSVTSPDAREEGIIQKSGTNAGAPYTDITLQFDTVGKLLGYNGESTEITPPSVFIVWNSRKATPSILTLNFGDVGANKAMRIRGDKSVTVTNTISPPTLMSSEDALRMKNQIGTLTAQAGSGDITDAQRAKIQAVMGKLREGLQTTAATTEFNEVRRFPSTPLRD